MKGLPFNKYTWLTTHNSYAQAGVRSTTGSLIFAPMNQNDTVTSQLKVSTFFFSGIFYFPLFSVFFYLILLLFTVHLVKF